MEGTRGTLVKEGLILGCRSPKPRRAGEVSARAAPAAGCVHFRNCQFVDSMKEEMVP